MTMQISKLRRMTMLRLPTMQTTATLQRLQATILQMPTKPPTLQMTLRNTEDDDSDVVANACKIK